MREDDKDPGMDLILWRHADAEDGFPDHARALTSRGRRQAEKVAAWLKARLPEKTRIAASPAVRSVQTAEALAMPFETVEEIAPGADVASLLHAAGWPDARGCVVLVGHQPTLGKLAGLLLFGQEIDLSIKKGCVWWLTNRVRNDEQQTVLKAVMTAELA
jgi:phosphohistidine phosphatase